MKSSHTGRALGVIVLLSLVALALAACETIPITADNNGETIALKRGETLEIQLDANPTTGYTWILDAIDETVVKQRGEPEYKAADSDTNLDGGGGTSIWRFAALTVGESPLRLIYARPGEEDTPAEVFEITVQVD